MRSATQGLALLALLLGIPRIAPAWQDRPPEAPRAVPSEEIRRNGPPADRPADAPGPPPGPDLFYVPGEFVPDGNTVAWKPGFWTRKQAGWTWMPAHWSRDSDGWTFHEGRWVRSGPRPKAPAADQQSAAGQTLVLDSRLYPANLYASSLWNPNLLYGYGYGYPYGLYGWGWPGYTVYSPGYRWFTGYGFGGIGAVTPYFTPGFAVSYPYWGWGGWGGFGGWGFWPGYWW
jgi:hypothetical protein